MFSSFSFSFTVSKAHYYRNRAFSSSLGALAHRVPVARVFGIFGPVAAFAAVVYASLVVLSTGGVLSSWD